MGLSYILYLMLLVILLLYIIYWVGFCAVLQKAGKPFWYGLIPIFSLYILLKIVEASPLWLLLFFLPWINILAYIVILYKLSKKFSKGVGFTTGLVLFPFIFFPVLGFGSSTYEGGDLFNIGKYDDVLDVKF